MSNPDLYTNRIGDVLVVAPALEGRLSQLAEQRNVVFGRDQGEQQKGLTRWVFANIPKNSLSDQWGNPYDHQVHTLIVGTLQEGNNFIAQLKDRGFHVNAASDMFVPFQTLNINDRQSSDSLRTSHPRAFALSRRERKQLSWPLKLTFAKQCRALTASMRLLDSSSSD